MKDWMVLAWGLSAATALGACDSRHCGALAAITMDAAAPVGSPPADAAVERIAVQLPEAGDLRGAEAGDSSSVAVKGTFNACPNVFAATASPPLATVGESVTVSVAASDPDPSDQLTYAWTASAGTFAMPLAASTTYVCAQDGTASITVKVSDGGCTETATIMVACQTTGADR